MRRVELGEIASYQNGYAFKPADWSTQGVPIIRIQNLNDPEKDYNYYRGDDVDEKYFVQNGDVLIAWSASLGVYVWNRGDSWLNQHTFKVNFENDQVDQSYFVYAIQETLKRIENQLHGSTMKHITKKKFLKLKIPLPSLSEQKAIVAKLDRAQRLIDIDKEMLAKYDGLIQSVFLEMFGDPVTNPKGWEKKKLDEFSVVQIGPFGSLLHKEDYIENGIPLVNPKNIVGSKIITDNEKTITNKKAKELNKYILRENDIVLGRRGEMGRCAVVTAKENGYLCGTGSLLIRSELNPILLSKILSSNSMVSQLEEIANGVTMKNLNSKIVSGLEIPIPPDEIINKYEKLIDFIESEKINQKKLIKKSEELFSSLVQGAFE